MGFFNPDMEDMLEVFQTESMELMDRMEACLMSEEKRDQFTTEALQGIFRIVHTMKSSAAMMGLEEMSSCTHRLEDLFLLYRDEPERAARVGKRIFELLYAYVDYVRSETARMADEDYRPAGAGELLRQVEQELYRAQKNAPEEKGSLTRGEKEISGGGRENGAGVLPEVIPEALSVQPERVYQWRIRLQDDCQMENVRAFLIVKQIRPLCGSLFTTPEDLQAREAAGQIRKDGLLVCFTTAESELVLQKLVSCAYVKEVEELGEPPEEAEEKPDVEKRERPEKERLPASKMGMVSWSRILHLQNVTGELVTLANMLEKEITGTACSDRLEELVLNNRRLLQELEEVVNDVSLMPVSGMVNQYSRVIRDICKKEEKEISFQVQGEDLEVDKTLTDSLTNPLLHLIRNAADHGIESREERIRAGKPEVGNILFAVSSMGENLLFSVSDDGCGLNREKILQKAEESGMLKRPKEAYTEEEIWQFIFRSGFSTSGTVTEFSGRGVGLDVVQKAVDRLRGSVYVESHPGQGTTITVSVPVSLTSIDSLCFTLERHTCFIPAKNVIRIYPYQRSLEKIRSVDGREYFQEEELIPLIRLRTAYGLPAMKEEEKVEAVLMVVRGIRHKMAFVADAIEGKSTIVEKALPDMIPQEYRRQTGIDGCAVTADGTIGYILNVDWIMRAYERGDLYGQTSSGHAGA